MAEANLASALEIWAGASDGGGFERGEGWLLGRAPVPLRSFNNVLVMSERADISGAVAAAGEHGRHSGGKFRVRLREDLAIEPSRLEAAGLERAGGIPTLVLTDVAASALPELDIRPVTEHHTLSDHVQVVASAFAWDPALLARVFTPRLLADDRWRGFIGYAGDRPVASSQVVLGGDGLAAGVYYVGTVEPYRRSGLGEALTRRAINEAVALGYEAVSLQASPLGQPIYERMRFRQMSYYETYVPSEEASR